MSEIERQRTEMHRLAERYGYRSAEVLEASQALDGLIREEGAAMTGKRMTKEAYCVLCEVGCETNPEILRLNGKIERLKNIIDGHVNLLAEKEAEILRLQRRLLLSEQEKGELQAENARLKKQNNNIVEAYEEQGYRMRQLSESLDSANSIAIGEYHYWIAGEANHLETILCPVVIPAEWLRNLLDEAREQGRKEEQEAPVDMEIHLYKCGHIWPKENGEVSEGCPVCKLKAEAAAMREALKEIRYKQELLWGRAAITLKTTTAGAELLKRLEKAETENAHLKTALDKINNIAVGFHENGPHDPSTAFAMVSDIYRLSLTEEDSANET
jgi:hypothetical protein